MNVKLRVAAKLGSIGTVVVYSYWWSGYICYSVLHAPWGLDISGEVCKVGGGNKVAISQGCCYGEGWRSSGQWEVKTPVWWG